MKKPVTFRIETTLMQQLKQLPGSTTHNLEQAIRMYCTPQVEPQYNQDIVTVLRQEIQDLRNDKEQLQHRLDIYTLPWYIRIIRYKQLLLPPRTR